MHNITIHSIQESLLYHYNIHTTDIFKDPWIFRRFFQHRIHNNIFITKISSLSKIKPLLYTPYASKLALVLCMYPMHTCSLLNHLWLNYQSCFSTFKSFYQNPKSNQKYSKNNVFFIRHLSVNWFYTNIFDTKNINI